MLMLGLNDTMDYGEQCVFVCLEEVAWSCLDNGFRH